MHACALEPMHGRTTSLVGADAGQHKAGCVVFNGVAVTQLREAIGPGDALQDEVGDVDLGGA